MSKASDGPSKASLREMPDATSTRFRPLGRGLYAKKAREAFGTLLIERAILDRLGGEEGALKILAAVAESLAPRKGRPGKRGTKRAA